MASKWTKGDLSSVTINTLFNGLWLGTLAWLVLGLWLELINFFYCWIGATVISWPVAILRVGKAIEIREEVRADVEQEFEKRDELRTIFDMLDKIERKEKGRGLRYIKNFVTEALISDVEQTKEILARDGVNERALCFGVIQKVLEQELTSGKYHTYRGVLSEIGAQLLTLWDYGVEQRRKAGVFDDEEAGEELKWMRDEIAKVG